MRLIDADAFENRLRELQKDFSGIPCFTIGEIINFINAEPAIEERKKGEWIKKEGDLCFRDVCSECGNKYVKLYPHYKHYNFCPNCGADMRGEEHDN